MKRALFVVPAAVVIAIAAPADAQRRGPQPGQTGGGPTTGQEMMQPFSPEYFLGEWEIEWTPPDTELLTGGMYTGTETVTHINNRFMHVDVRMEGEDGNVITGQGLILYDWGLNGQSLVRYVVYDAGFALLQHGHIGGDLGGYYSHFWDTPQFSFNEHTFAMKGRSYYVSPAAYRVNQQISVDGAEFFNFGIMWLTKEVTPASGQ